MIKLASRIFLLALCACALSSCGTIFYLVQTIIQIPFQILNAVI